MGEGAGATRYGVLLRSDTLCRLTERGLRAFTTAGVGTVIDLRSADELVDDPNPLSASGSVRYLNLPLHNEGDKAAIVRIASYIALSEMYRLILTRFGPQIAVIVDAVATADPAVVVHCYAGKDRTGLVIALILAVVGVENGLIAADYAASHHRLAVPRDARIGAAPLAERVLREHRLGAEAKTMLEVLAWLETEHGGAEAYLLAAGTGHAILDRLRQRLVALPAGATGE